MSGLCHLVAPSTIDSLSVFLGSSGPPEVIRDIPNMLTNTRTAAPFVGLQTQNQCGLHGKVGYFSSVCEHSAYFSGNGKVSAYFLKSGASFSERMPKPTYADALLGTRWVELSLSQEGSVLKRPVVVCRIGEALKPGPKPGKTDPPPPPPNPPPPMTRKARVEDMLARVAWELTKNNLTTKEYKSLTNRERLLKLELQQIEQLEEQKVESKEEVNNPVTEVPLDEQDDISDMPALEPVNPNPVLPIIDLTGEEPTVPLLNLSPQAVSTAAEQVAHNPQPSAPVVDEQFFHPLLQPTAPEDHKFQDMDIHQLVELARYEGFLEADEMVNLYGNINRDILQTPGLLDQRNTEWCRIRLAHPPENNPRTWRTVKVGSSWQLIVNTQGGNTKDYYIYPISVFLKHKMHCRVVRPIPKVTFNPDLQPEPTFETGWVQHGLVKIYEPLVDNVAGSLYGLIKRKEVKDMDRAAVSLVDAVADTWAKPEKEGGKNLVCIKDYIVRAETAAAAIERANQVLAKTRDAVQTSTDFVVDETKFGVTYTTARERTKAYLAQYAIRRGFCTRLGLLMSTGRWFPRYEIPLSSHQLSPLWQTKLDSWIERTGAVQQNQSEGFDRIVDTLNMKTPLIPSVRPFRSPPPTYQPKPIREN